MITSLLVPTDFSPQARQALRYAISLARQIKASILLFHAFHEPLSVADTLPFDPAKAKLEMEKVTQMQGYVAEIRRNLDQDFRLSAGNNQDAITREQTFGTLPAGGYLPGASDEDLAERRAVPITCLSQLEMPVEGILQTIEVYGPDLVIMSQRQKGQVSPVAPGSTVAGVIESGKAAVLALPENMPFKSIRKLAFATDLTRIPHYVSLYFLHSIVRSLAAELQVVHMSQDPDSIAEQQIVSQTLIYFEHFFPDIRRHVFFQQGNAIGRGIQDFLQNHPADLLALMPKHPPFRDMLFEQNSTGLSSKQATIPLLTLPFTATAERVVPKTRQEAATK
jgi:hypothetical protein